MSKVIVNAASAEHYVWSEMCDGWRLLAGTDLAVTQERIPPGCGEREHYHARARQLFFVLSGSLNIFVDATTFQLNTGDSLEVEPLNRHRVWNDGREDAHSLVISAPTTEGDRVNVEK